jgi:hypothetical protein
MDYIPSTVFISDLATLTVRETLILEIIVKKSFVLPT